MARIIMLIIYFCFFLNQSVAQYSHVNLERVLLYGFDKTPVKQASHHERKDAY